MACEKCAAYLAAADQLEREREDKERYEERLLERLAAAENRSQGLERQLREALDELRIRRAATGYQPVLDVPED